MHRSRRFRSLFLVELGLTRVCGAVGLLLVVASLFLAQAASAQAVPSEPRIRVLAPADGASITKSEVTFSLSVPRSLAVVPILVRIDNQLAPSRELGAERGASFPEDGPRATAPDSGEELRRVQVSVPPRSCAVSFVLDPSGPASVVYLKWAGSQEEYQIRPRLYILAIGVGAYPEQLQPLKYPAKDARDLAAAFQTQQGVLYRDVTTRLLIDQDATREDILSGLDWIKKETTQNDVAVILLAGHGINEPRNGDYYFVPYKGDISKPEITLISGAQIVNSLVGMAGKVLVFLDTCHAGNVMSAHRARGATDISNFVSELLNAGSALVVFAAATGRQTSKENDAWQNGAFTKAVVEGIRGKAARGSTGRITINMLDDYVTNTVKELTQGNQTPATAKPQATPDFQIALAPVQSPRDQVDPPKKPVPVYKRWWFWTLLGGTAAAATAIGIGVGIARSNDCPSRFAECQTGRLLP